MLWAVIAGRWLKAAPYLLIAALIAWGLYERHSARRWQDRAEQCASASEAAKRAQEALRAQERQAYERTALEADANYRAGLDRARAASRAYVDASRVRAPHDSSPTGPIGEADPARVPEGLPATTIVDSSDVFTCGDLYAYAMNTRDWALSITGDK